MVNVLRFCVHTQWCIAIYWPGPISKSVNKCREILSLRFLYYSLLILGQESLSRVIGGGGAVKIHDDRVRWQSFWLDAIHPNQYCFE